MTTVREAVGRLYSEFHNSLCQMASRHIKHNKDGTVESCNIEDHNEVIRLLCQTGDMFIVDESGKNIVARWEDTPV